MTTFYVLFVVVGAGVFNSSWGGPALLRFESRSECEATLTAIKSRDKPISSGQVWEAQCLEVNVRQITR